MGTPVLSKTYQFDVNNSVITDYPTFWYSFKEILKAFSPGWTVAGSCKWSVAGGMDAVDRWATSGDVVIDTAGNPGSWIVLENANLLGGIQWLINPRQDGSGFPTSIYMHISPGGLYTGGSATTLPTATDQVTLLTNANLLRNAVSTLNIRLHAMMSTDGEKTRVITTDGGASRNLFLIEEPTQAVSGWVNPWVAISIAYDGVSQPTTFENLANITTYCSSNYGAGVRMPLYCTSEGWKFDAISSAAGQRLTFANDLDSSGWPICPMGLVSETATMRGRHGQLSDIWWGSTAINDGDHYPDSLPRQFVQIGDVILPWDTTAGAISLT